ncbi:DUF1801 domain-containing protein [Flavihumibacter fluvii]|uniref:DUF1801 domain-containing protein n=1 Tax=Flavihumibacter fluvii TaxID=2838157 RepID=UPI001BDF5CCC|nr:DUF1801 domain-containing protein [Flavihumibacter fluvii]ULQ54674.1 DUF1801 domain-containing protein [Flavihumibacter fluvii]
MSSFAHTNYIMKAKSTQISDQEQVSQHIQKLEPALAVIIEVLRQIILSADKEVGERIKWNNPSFYYTGEMKPFDPKEYKRDIIVMNLFKGRIMLVFPSGAKISEKSGLLEGDYTDGRRTMVLKDLDDVLAKQKQLQHLIRAWIKLVDQ